MIYTIHRTGDFEGFWVYYIIVIPKKDRRVFPGWYNGIDDIFPIYGVQGGTP